jgi:hypothetical protein
MIDAFNEEVGIERVQIQDRECRLRHKRTGVKLEVGHPDGYMDRWRKLGIEYVDPKATKTALDPLVS